jgi:hypothetical protein
MDTGVNANKVCIEKFCDNPANFGNSILRGAAL